MQFQYLVGLCCLRCHPDAVEMTLGDKVLDAASKSERDVDVTITAVELNGNRTAFVGYEAKQESKPLHVNDVEQLSAKLNDMPDLTMRAMVSANGFSTTAINKAVARGVKLFEFRDWEGDVKASFPQLSLKGPAEDAILFQQTESRWVEPRPSVRINPEDPNRDHCINEIKNGTPLIDVEGNRHPIYNTVASFLNQFVVWIAAELAKTSQATSVLMRPLPYPSSKRPDGPFGEPVPFPAILSPIQGQMFFQTSQGRKQLKQIHLSGTLQWHYYRISAEFRVLADVESQDVCAGAAIANHPIKSNTLILFILGSDT